MAPDPDPLLFDVSAITTNINSAMSTESLGSANVGGDATKPPTSEVNAPSSASFAAASTSPPPSSSSSSPSSPSSTVPASSATATSTTSSSTKSSIHSSLRVVTNPGELGVSFPPPGPLLSSAGGKWTPGVLRSPSGLLLSPLGLLAKSFKLDTPDAAAAAASSSSSSSSAGLPASSSVMASSSIGFFDAASKELQFDPRFLAEAWSQESPQSVYALLGQPGALGGGAFTGFSPLAASSPSGGTRLLSPMAMGLLHHGSAASHTHPQSFMSHLQSPLLVMSPLAGSAGNAPSSCASSSSSSSSSAASSSSSTATAAASSASPSSSAASATPFYPPTVTIPPSPHQLNPHLLSPMFATAISPGGGLGVSPDMLSMIDPSTVFVPPSSPSAILRHLLPPVLPRAAALNVKDLTLNELRPHFNKPMAVVAKELGVCITLMKKICRRNGLVRWPHRRIRSLVNRITSLQVIASTAVGAEKKRFQSQINALRDELSAVIQNPNEKSRKAQADAKARTPPLAAPVVAAAGAGTTRASAAMTTGAAGGAAAAAAAAGVVSRKRRAASSLPPPATASHSALGLDADDLLDDDALYADENSPAQAKAQAAAGTTTTTTAKRTPSPFQATKKEPLQAATGATATRARAAAAAAAAVTADKAAASRPAALASTSATTTTTTTGKRSSARFRGAAPIKIPRQSEFEAAKRALDAEFGEQPSSTTSTGSCGKRGSISSILC